MHQFGALGTENNYPSPSSLPNKCPNRPTQFSPNGLIISKWTKIQMQMCKPGIRSQAENDKVNRRWGSMGSEGTSHQMGSVPRLPQQRAHASTCLAGTIGGFVLRGSIAKRERGLMDDTVEADERPAQERIVGEEIAVCILEHI